MLIDTMNNEEVSMEIAKDWDNIQGTIQRLTKDYDKLRRKRKIDKTREYPKVYEFKSKLKNKWILIISKGASATNYKGGKTLAFVPVVYYYSKVGLRVFKVPPRVLKLFVYNGHVFTRYNDRMNLDIKDPIKVVKHFFKNNPSAYGKIETGNLSELNFISRVKDGALLGHLQENGMWVVYKTFITKEQMRNEQESSTDELLNEFQNEIESTLNQDTFDRDDFTYKADTLSGIIK